MRLTKLLAAFALTALLAAGCVAPGQSPRASLNQSKPHALGAAPDDMLVTTAWLGRHLADEDLVLVHVGKDREIYSKTHIPGAVFLGWDEVAVKRNGTPNELPPLSELTGTLRRLGVTSESQVVLYDDDAGLPAARAYVALDYAGLGSQTKLLDGHLKKWRTEDRPLTDAVPEVAPSNFSPTPNPDVIVNLRDVQDISWLESEGPGHGTALIDARPNDQYTGETPGTGIIRPGHIPGAKNVYSMDNVQSEDNPVMRSRQELRDLYEKAGVKPGDLVVTYCRTGGQASLAYFTAKYLGMNVAMYDGSFFEWSNEEDVDVETGS